MPDVQTGDKERTPRHEWIENEAAKISWPTPEEIDNMDLNLDMFDIERFNSLNEERINNISKLEKDNYIGQDGKWNKDSLDKEMLNHLEPEEKKEYDRRIDQLDLDFQKRAQRVPEEGSGIDTMEKMLHPF